MHEIFPRKNRQKWHFQLKIEENAFFENAFKWYYIDSSPTFYPYIIVLQNSSRSRLGRTFKAWNLNKKNVRKTDPPLRNKGPIGVKSSRCVFFSGPILSSKNSTKSDQKSENVFRTFRSKK